MTLSPCTVIDFDLLFLHVAGDAIEADQVGSIARVGEEIARSDHQQDDQTIQNHLRLNQLPP